MNSILNEIFKGKDKMAMTIVTLVFFYGILLFYSFSTNLILLRFHQDLSFWKWAIQQPIPSMYNLENKVEVIRYNKNGKVNSTIRWINHHPTRLIYENKHVKETGVSKIEYVFTSSNWKEKIETNYILYNTGDNHFKLEKIDD